MNTRPKTCKNSTGPVSVRLIKSPFKLTTSMVQRVSHLQKKYKNFNSKNVYINTLSTLTNKNIEEIKSSELVKFPVTEIIENATTISRSTYINELKVKAKTKFFGEYKDEILKLREIYREKAELKVNDIDKIESDYQNEININKNLKEKMIELNDEIKDIEDRIMEKKNAIEASQIKIKKFQKVSPIFEEIITEFPTEDPKELILSFADKKDMNIRNILRNTQLTEKLDELLLDQEKQNIYCKNYNKTLNNTYLKQERKNRLKNKEYVDNLFACNDELQRLKDSTKENYLLKDILYNLYTYIIKAYIPTRKYKKFIELIGVDYLKEKEKFTEKIFYSKDFRDLIIENIIENQGGSILYRNLEKKSNIKSFKKDTDRTKNPSEAKDGVNCVEGKQLRITVACSNYLLRKYLEKKEILRFDPKETFREIKEMISDTQFNNYRKDCVIHGLKLKNQNYKTTINRLENELKLLNIKTKALLRRFRKSLELQKKINCENSTSQIELDISNEKIDKMINTIDKELNERSISKKEEGKGRIQTDYNVHNSKSSKSGSYCVTSGNTTRPRTAKFFITSNDRKNPTKIFKNSDKINNINNINTLNTNADTNKNDNLTNETKRTLNLKTENNLLIHKKRNPKLFKKKKYKKKSKSNTYRFTMLKNLGKNQGPKTQRLSEDHMQSFKTLSISKNQDKLYKKNGFHPLHYFIPSMKTIIHEIESKGFKDNLYEKFFPKETKDDENIKNKTIIKEDLINDDLSDGNDSEQFEDILKFFKNDKTTRPKTSYLNIGDNLNKNIDAKTVPPTLRLPKETVDKLSNNILEDIDKAITQCKVVDMRDFSNCVVTGNLDADMDIQNKQNIQNLLIETNRTNSSNKENIISVRPSS